MSSKTSTQPPITGNQYSINSGAWQAVITELGATLRVLRWQGHDIIVPFDPNKPAPCCNGWILSPYPNRLTSGQYTFNGVSYQVPINEPERGCALHGYSHAYFWSLEALEEDHVTLSWRAPALEGYPFDVTVSVTYVLDDSGLLETVSVRNDGETPAPWALGIHPWLSNGSNALGDAIQADNDRCTLQLDCRTHVTVDEHLLPTGEEPVDGTIYDLRESQLLKDRPFDDAWTDVERVADGSTSAIFTRPDGVQVTITGDKTINAWQVCTGTGFPAEIHQPGVAVEPMTAYADAFRSGKHLVTVEPGDEYTTVLGFTALRV